MERKKEANSMEQVTLLNSVITVIYPSGIVDQVFYSKNRDSHYDYIREFYDWTPYFYWFWDPHLPYPRPEDFLFSLIQKGCPVVILDNIEEKRREKWCYHFYIPLPLRVEQEELLTSFLEEKANHELLGEFYFLESNQVKPVLEKEELLSTWKQWMGKKAKQKKK